MLYEMMFGDLPFYSVDESEHIDAILVEDLDFSLPQWKHLSLELQDLIDQLLQKKPGLRLTPQEILAHPWFNSQL